MDHKNYERELKYLLKQGCTLNSNDVFKFLMSKGFYLIENKNKRKDEVYYDDEKMTSILNGDVIRCSSYINKDGVFKHFMFKKNDSNPSKPYVSKYEFGSGSFATIDDFLDYCGLEKKAPIIPVLCASMIRTINIFEKSDLRVYVTCDDVEYYRETGSERVFEQMLEIEDWTNPNSIENYSQRDDSLLLEVHDLLLNDSGLPILLTKDSKPLRGYTLLRYRDV